MSLNKFKSTIFFYLTGRNDNVMKRRIKSIFTAVIIDPLRLNELIEILEPLISSQIELADLVIISKTDLASAGDIDKAKKTVRGFNGEAPLLPTSLKGGLESGLEKELLPWLN